MKKIFESLTVLAAVISFTSCQKESDALEATHRVSFIAGAPVTKTTASIDEDGKAVDYAWTEADKGRFTLYEIKEGEYVPATETKGTLEEDGRMLIEADFEGAATAGASYIALFNSSVKADQTTGAEEYDQESDVLISKVVTSESIESEPLYLSFRREVAIAEATLKNLSVGEKVSSIIIESTDGTVLAAEYDLQNGEFKSEGSTSVDSIEMAGLSLPIDKSEHTATFRFVTVPVADAQLKVSVTTVDGSGNVVGKYVKEFSKPITFERGNLKSFNIVLECTFATYTASLTGASFDKEVNSYSGEFSSTTGSFKVNLANFNNNNKGWDFVKTGDKSAAIVGTITTDAAISEKINKITVTIDAITASSVNSINVYTGSSATECTTLVGTINKSPGEQSLTISTPEANKFYKISFDCKKGSSKGFVCVSKIVYSAE